MYSIVVTTYPQMKSGPLQYMRVTMEEMRDNENVGVHTMDTMSINVVKKRYIVVAKKHP